MTNEKDHAKEQAQAQYDCISEMTERLDHCRNCSEDFDSGDCELMDRFDDESDFDDYHNEDDAQQTIYDDPLSVEVRSGWASSASEFEAEDFMILLCTGGPACRIRGELCNGEPDRAWLEYQDWGTPWARFFGADQDVLLDYARNFYFGE